MPLYLDGITKNHISAAPITTPTSTLTIVIAPLLGSLYDDLGSITSLPLRGLLSSSFTFFLGKKLPDISLSLIFWLWFICSRYLLARVLFLSILSTEFRSFLALWYSLSLIYISASNRCAFIKCGLDITIFLSCITAISVFLSLAYWSDTLYFLIALVTDSNLFWLDWIFFI